MDGDDDDLNPNAGLIGAEAAALLEDDDDGETAADAGASEGATAAEAAKPEAEAAKPATEAAKPAVAATETAAVATETETAVTGEVDDEVTPDDVPAAPPGALAFVEVPDTAGLPEEKTDLLAKRAEHRAAYAAGDLSREELDDKLDQISDRLSEINSTISDATQATRWNHSVAVANYNGLISTVKGEARAQGIDYDKNATLLSLWDSKVRTMGKDPEMVKKGDAWILREAHRLTVKDFRDTAKAMGLTLPDAKPAEGGPSKAAMQQAVKEAVNARKTDPGKVKSLATLPEAAKSAVSTEDEFSRMDGLDGMALERELAKLTPEAAARYLERA